MTYLSVDHSLLKAAKLEKIGETNKAEELYLQLLKKFPQNKRVFYKIAKIHKLLANDHINYLTILFKNEEFMVVADEATILTKKYCYSLDLLNLLGLSLNAVRRFDEAIGIFSKIINIDPSFDKANFNLALSYQSIGRYLKACEYYELELKITPNDFITLHNLSLAQKKLGNYKEAIHTFELAIKINSNSPSTFLSLGVLYKSIGNYSAAIENYKKAIIANPNFAEAYYNIGIVQNVINEIDKSTNSYQKAIEIRPNYFQAYNNLGTNKLLSGNVNGAISDFQKALEIKPDYTDALYNITDVLNGIIFNNPNSKVLSIIETIIDKKIIVRPYEIANCAISLMKFDNHLKCFFKKYTNKKIKKLLFKFINKFSKNAVLGKFLKICPMPNLDLEQNLTKIRSYILQLVHEEEFSREHLIFISTLSQQCFINEYIYSLTNHEKIKIEKLENLIKKLLLRGIQPKPQLLLCLSTYKGLNEFKWRNLIEKNQIIDEVYTQQITEFNKENDIKFNIEILGNITDSISSKVRNQYETNPYPRWINTGLPRHSINISDLNHLQLYNQNIKNCKTPYILIAGSGTGQHSLYEALRFKDSNVTAIDLSLGSLAYAFRKTKELKLDNIKYMQADILNLKKLNFQYDIIESVGVLHHMKDPIEGWKVLTNCLKKGGLMRLGLYSESARKYITKIREDIKKLGLMPNAEEMRIFRETIIKSDDKNHKIAKNIVDFYSMSTLRDFLFHVQEHKFNVIQIKEILDKLGLKFCGFEDRNLIDDFEIYFSQKIDKYDLSKWDIYEKQKPDAFHKMYQFWCQKV